MQAFKHISSFCNIFSPESIQKPRTQIRRSGAKDETIVPGKQGILISISGCTLVGAASSQAPPNAGSPASHVSIPDDEKGSPNAPQIISVHIQRIFRS